MGTGNPILKDIQVRQAIALGINRPELVTKVLDGNGIVGAGYLPPGYPQCFWKPSSSEALDYDPARAKQMLDDGRLQEGLERRAGRRRDGKPLEFRLGIHSDDATDAAIAPYLKEWMSAIGIKLDVERDELRPAEQQPGQGRLGHADGRLEHGPRPDVPAVHPDLRDAARGRRLERQHRRVLLRPEVRQAVRSSSRRSSTRSERAATIAQMQGILYAANADMILFYKNGLDALRTDQVVDYLQGDEAVRRVLPAAARVHQLVEGAAGRAVPPRPARRRASRAPTPSSGSVSASWSSS